MNKKKQIAVICIFVVFMFDAYSQVFPGKKVLGTWKMIDLTLNGNSLGRANIYLQFRSDGSYYRYSDENSDGIFSKSEQVNVGMFKIFTSLEIEDSNKFFNGKWGYEFWNGTEYLVIKRIDSDGNSVEVRFKKV